MMAMIYSIAATAPSKVRRPIPEASQSSPASDVTTIVVEGTGAQSVTFGHAFAQGEVPSGNKPVLTDTSDVSVTTQQADVLATWGDGSVKHASMSAVLTGGVTYKVRSGTQPGGSNLTTAGLLAAVAGNIATVTLSGGITGAAILRDLIESATNRAPGGLKTVEQGPAMLGLVVSQDFSTHVRITFHLRWYGGTTLWCDFIAENGYGNLNSQGDKAYTAVCDLNGSTVLNTGAITHWNHAMWHRAGWSTGGTLYVKHNVAHLRDTVKAVPYYDPATTPSSAFLNTLPSTPPAPMAKTAFWGIPDNIESTGANSHIGLLPQWDALYIKADGDSRAFNAMLTGSDSCMVYPTCYMSSTDGEHMRVSDYTTTTITGGTGFGTGVFSSANPNGGSTGWMASHSPSAGFLPYLLTARYAYLRTMAAWASEHAMWANTNRNVSFGGMTVRLFYKDQKRGWGWSYRTTAQAAWALPDAHSSKTYFNNVVNGNFSTDNTDYVSPGTQATNRGGGSMGFVYDWDWEQNGVTWYSGFMHAFLSQAVSYVALDLGFSAGVGFAKYVAKFIAGLMGARGDFPFELAAAYSFHAGATTGTYYSTWESFRADTANCPSSATNLDSGTTAMASAVLGIAPRGYTGIRNEIIGDMGAATDYFANYLPAISYLERLELDGGWAAWYKTQLCGRAPDFTQAPQFGIAKRAMPKPAWVQALTLKQWTRLANTAPSSQNPASGYSFNPQGKIDAWTGNVLKIRGSDYIIPAQGGHNDYSGNEIIGIKLNAETPAWRTILAITPQAQQTDNAARYADGRPSSRHGYYNQVFLDGADTILMHGCTYAFTAGSATQFDAADRFDMAAGSWSQVASPASGIGAIKAMGLSYASELVYYLKPYYVAGGSALCVYRPFKNTTTTITTSVTATEDYRSGALDPKRGVFLVGPGTASQTSTWASFSIDSGTETSRTATIAQSGGGAGLVYDPDGDVYLFWNGGDIYSINPSTFAKTALNTTGTPPGATAAGCFGKFQYVPELGIVVTVDAIGNNVAVCKIR